MFEIFLPASGLGSMWRNLKMRNYSNWELIADSTILFCLIEHSPTTNLDPIWSSSCTFFFKLPHSLNQNCKNNFSPKFKIGTIPMIIKKSTCQKIFRMLLKILKHQNTISNLLQLLKDQKVVLSGILQSTLFWDHTQQN